MRKILALATVVAAAALFSGAAGATTVHQVQHLADGSAVTFTLATGSAFPAPGAGMDVGDFGPADGASHSGVLPSLAPVTSLGGVQTAAASGSQTMSGTVSFSNMYGVTLWTYGEQVSWSYGSYTVQSIYNQWAGALNTCCLWGFHGNASLSHGPAGGANFQAFAQGTFQACVLWACETKSPYITLQGNGNGNQTGFWWGIG